MNPLQERVMETDQSLMGNGEMNDKLDNIERGLVSELLVPLSSSPQHDWSKNDDHSEPRHTGENNDTHLPLVENRSIQSNQDPPSLITAEDDDDGKLDQRNSLLTAKRAEPAANEELCCPICLEDFDDNGEDGGDVETGRFLPQRVTLSPCRHVFCRDCVRNHCRYAIAAHTVPIPCPRHNRDVACVEMVSCDTVQNVLLRQRLQQQQEQHTAASLSDTKDMQTWFRYQKLYLLSLDSNLMECPACDSLVQATTATTASTTSGSTIQNDLQCTACQHRFCRVHGSSHVGISCAQYQGTPEGRSMEETERALDAWTKPCSHCGCRLQKATGCDHVLCVACGQDMCWKCGTHVHLTGKVIRHCARCQSAYRDHRYDYVYRFRLCLCLPILAPLILVYMALSATAAIVTGCFCGCFQCGRCLEFHSKTTTTAPIATTIATNTGETNGGEGIRTRGHARHGVWATIVVLFLPAIALLEDFGYHVRILDELFPEQIRHNEMPFLEVDDNHRGTTVVHGPIVSEPFPTEQ